MSLRLRLFLSHAIVIVVGLTVLFLALLVLLRQTETRRSQRQLGNTAAAIARIGRPLLQSDNPQRLIDRLIAARPNQAQRARVLLLDAGGVVIADSATNSQASMVNETLALGATVETTGIVSEDSAVGEFRDPQGRRWLYAAVPTPGNARGSVGWFVLAQSSGGPLLGLVDDLSAPLLQALMIALVISAIAAALVARSIAQPIHKVATGAKALAQGNYNERVPVSGPLEVKQLAADFNHMATQVQMSQQTEHELVANVSHELKTPLTSIQGFAQAIRDGDVSDAESTRNAARIIYNEAERLRRLVGELLESARMESGDVRMARDTVRLNDLAAACITKMQPHAQRAGIQLTTQLADVPLITADGDRLGQVVTNLIDNALKHTPSGGKVTVETRLAQRKNANRSSKRSGIEISVSDNGSGIPPEDLLHIFDRFYQADKSRSRSASGSGLGLSICKQIIEAHGGQMEAHSVLGLGTRMSAWLPLNQEPKVLREL